MFHSGLLQGSNDLVKFEAFKIGFSDSSIHVSQLARVVFVPKVVDKILALESLPPALAPNPMTQELQFVHHNLSHLAMFRIRCGQR